MTITGLILAAAMLVVTLLYVLMPLVTGSRRSSGAFISRQRERALAYYERVLTNVRDLDEDHSTGKMSTEEYEAERVVWVERGVRVLRLLDELSEQHNIVDNTEADDAAIDAAIEAAIRKRKPQEAS